MSGVDVIGALLRGSAPLAGLVPPERIKAGELPDGMPLPALLVRSVSLVDRVQLKRGGVVRSTERVAVTVRAASYRDQRAVIKIVRSCCGGFVAASLVGLTNVTARTDGLGPDVTGPADSFEQTQDLRTSFNAPA